VNFVMLEQEEQRVRRMLDRHLQNKQFRILTADGSPLRSVPIAAALRRGEIVALHGDRTFGGASVTVPFLGADAPFPIGAYVLASATGAPVFQVFAVRERLGHYRFFSFPAMQVPRGLDPRKPEAFKAYAGLYAERLAAVARQYPFQWQNFYPFWDGREEPAQGRERRGIRR
jgi:predicted LPLAT superfamily acyltransferase